MEAMPYHDDLAAPPVVDWSRPVVDSGRDVSVSTRLVVAPDWRDGLPALYGSGVTLRRLRRSDASSLFELLTTEEVSRFISPPPTSVEGFERFIDWTDRQRAAGLYVCFAVVPAGHDVAVGLFQIRASHDGFSTAEWGFALGSPYWGTGLFVRGAELALEFAFTTLRVHRLEARAALLNGRGNSALQKLGAIKEAFLRRSVRCRGQRLDQALWTILADEWRTPHRGLRQRPSLMH